MIHHYSDPPEHRAQTVYLTAEELTDLLAFWAPRLGLQAWQIELHITSSVDMPREGAQGAARTGNTLRRAIVHLLDPRDHRPGEHLHYDMETTLVHELLHLLTASWSKDSDFRNKVTEDACMEQPIEQLSVALVALRRATETKRNRKGVWA